MPNKTLLLAATIALAFAGSARADEVLESAASCIESLTGFNEDRPWAQLSIDRERVLALVESAREDRIYVELGCTYDGNVFEGRRLQLPIRMTGGRGGLDRAKYDASTLARAVDAALRQGGDGEWQSITITDLPGSMTTPLTTVVFDGDRTVNLGPTLSMTATRPPPASEMREAAPPAPTGTQFASESLLDDPIRVFGYLEGAVGREPVQRVVIQPQMILVAYGPASATKVRNWFLHDGAINGQDPEPAGPSAGSRCKTSPTLGEARGSLTRVMQQHAASIKRSMMLLLECDAPGKPIRWQVIGGDGVVKEGQPLKQDYYPF